MTTNILTFDLVRLVSMAAVFAVMGCKSGDETAAAEQGPGAVEDTPSSDSASLAPDTAKRGGQEDGAVTPEDGATTPDDDVAQARVDVSEHVRERLPLDGDSESGETWSPTPSAMSGAHRVVSGIVLAVGEPFVELMHRVDGYENLVVGGLLYPITISLDRDIDWTWLAAADLPCGYIEYDDGDTATFFWDAGVEDLYREDGTPSPDYTFHDINGLPPASSGIEVGASVLVIVQNSTTRTFAADGMVTKPFLRWSAPLEGDTITLPTSEKMTVSSLESMAKEMWPNQRAFCDWVLDGQPEDKTWKDYLPAD